MIILQVLIGFILISGVLHVLHLIGKTLLVYVDEAYIPDLTDDLEERLYLYLSYAVLGAAVILVLLFVFGICMKIGQVFL